MTEEAGQCPGRVVSRKLILPRTSSCLGPTSFASLGTRTSPPLCLAPWDTLCFSSVDASWSSLISLLQFFCVNVEPGLSVDCWPACPRCLAPAEFSSSSLPGVASVPANRVRGVGWWEVAKTSPPAHNAPSSEENFYILWTI